MGTVWKIKTADAPGWLEQTCKGQPLITGSVHEAQQFPSRAAAEAVIASMPRDRVLMHPVESAPHTVELHGDPTIMFAGWKTETPAPLPHPNDLRG